MVKVVATLFRGSFLSLLFWLKPLFKGSNKKGARLFNQTMFWSSMSNNTNKMKSMDWAQELHVDRRPYKNWAFSDYYLGPLRE